MQKPTCDHPGYCDHLGYNVDVWVAWFTLLAIGSLLLLLVSMLIRELFPGARGLVRVGEWVFFLIMLTAKFVARAIVQRQIREDSPETLYHESAP